MSDRSETEAHQKMAHGRCKLKKEKRREKKKRKGKETTLLEIKTVTPACDTAICPLPPAERIPGESSSSPWRELG